MRKSVFRACDLVVPKPTSVVVKLARVIKLHMYT